MIELLGIVLVVQGIGGFINRVTDSDSASWFVQLHLLPPGWHIPASIAMAVVGLALASAGAAKRKRST